jgi:beta-N-acetylhexosaminidase
MKAGQQLDRLAAACLFPGFDGRRVPEWLRPWLEAGLGGVVLFARNVGDAAQLRALTDDLHGARPGLLVATDEEGGDVTRLEASTGSSYPGACALGVVDDVELTERVAAAMGADLRAAGVDVDFAPVADVNSNPANPVIGIRSFGADAALVSRHVTASVRGLQAAGVAACAKHFPGHGDTHQDSHLELPTVDFHAAALEPFRAAIAAGARAVMTAHIRVPALDDAPATLSERVIGDLLRRELAFDGAVFTDALEMGAISGTLGTGQAAVRALAAGADALVLGHDIGSAEVEGVHAAVLAAVASGRLAEERVAEAAGRVDRLSRWVREAPHAPAGDGSVAREAARRALTIDGDVSLGASPLVLELRPEDNIAAGPARWTLGDALAERLPDARTIVVTDSSSSADGVDADVLVLRDAGRHRWQREAAESLLRRSPQAVVVEIGLPAWRPPGAQRYVATHGAGRANLEAAAERLAGR